MADKPTDKVEAAAPATDLPDASTAEAKVDATDVVAEGDQKPDEAIKEDAAGVEDSTKASKTTESTDANAPEKSEPEETKQSQDDVEIKDSADAGATENEPHTTSTSETPSAKSKSRRKSTAGEPKGKTLNKKGSKARLTHTDAKPGDHFLVKLKGFPAWPAVVCDESMLPVALINSRPVTAAKPDGTYAEAYADGGKRVNDRTFPVMYLYTNEFGWVSNTVLSELTPEKAKDSITDKMRKDLRAAFDLASEHNSLDFYKQILNQFQEDLAAAAADVTPKKSKKSKAKAADDEDVEMEDADAEVKPKSSKKRKAEDDVQTPQRPDSVKKPKIKLNTSSTPKAANGTSTPKAKDEPAVKAAKVKAKKGKEKEGGDKKAEPSKESKMTPEERRARKEKEVLYLRHKLQRGLLTRDQQPQESEMKQMSDFITMLEGFADLEVSIIRTTKINKVLKTILKLESIPREEEFHFKDRSQALLDKWNKLMAGDATTEANGVNGTEGPVASKADTNGVKADTGDSAKVEVTGADDEAKVKSEVSKPENGTDDKEDTAEEAAEETAKEGAAASEPVEASA
ncbi:hypothetical protein S40288_03504 [Stachybotrys chartarum IBT 40288]|nr:hypothetical protein S40288_03504 [Stachybotrys chartarum IBT 40288]